MRLAQAINQDWYFCKKEEGAQLQMVTLPHTYNAVDGQDGSPMYRGPVEYRKTLYLEKEAGKVYYLEIGAASLACEVFVNGHSCLKSTCGYSLIRAKVDAYLQEGENEILIHVTNGSTAKLYPCMADFSFYGGLYRGVKLITEDPLHFAETDGSRDGIILQPEIGTEGQGVLKVTASCVLDQPGREQENTGAACARDFAGAVCRVRLLDASGRTVAEEQQAVSSDTCHLTLETSDLHRWNGVEDPYLYTAEISLEDGDGVVRDHRTLMTGFKTVGFDPEKGFLLNDRPIKLNGVAKHQDFGGLGNVLNTEKLTLDMSLIREIGANSIRCSHYQHPDEWYDLCDRSGMLIWAEVPVISVVAQNPEADRNAFEQLDLLIAQARNHCSIYCWGVQNETCMGSNNAYTHDLVRRLALHAKELDPARMTAQANEYTTQDDCPILDHTDISGHNLYYGWYYGEIPQLQERLESIHAHHPQTPLILTEYGVDTNVQFHSLTPKANDYTEEYQLKFHANALKAINERSWMAGGYVWNMFDFGSAGRDEGGTKGKNQKGMVTIDRKIRKDVFYLYKACWSKEPFVYLAGRRFVNRPQKETDITVLSNMQQLQLTVNGSSSQARSSEGICTVFEKVSLLPGTNDIVITGQNADGLTCIDRITINRVDTPDPTYTLKAKAKVVVDWFAGLEGEDFGIADTPIRPEGFSFEDIIQDIYDNEQAKGIFLKFLRPLTLNARFEGMKPFTTVKQLLQFANRDGSIPEALLRHCQQELNKIDK